MPHQSLGEFVFRTCGCWNPVIESLVTFFNAALSRIFPYRTSAGVCLNSCAVREKPSSRLQNDFIMLILCVQGDVVSKDTGDSVLQLFARTQLKLICFTQNAVSVIQKSVQKWANSTIQTYTEKDSAMSYRFSNISQAIEPTPPIQFSRIADDASDHCRTSLELRI